MRQWSSAVRARTTRAVPAPRSSTAGTAATSQPAVVQVEISEVNEQSAAAEPATQPASTQPVVQQKSNQNSTGTVTELPTDEVAPDADK